MHELNFSFQNVVDGNGWNISIVGMSIVFLGLICISLYIRVLPKILAFIHDQVARVEGREAKPKIPKPVSLTNLELSAIAYVVEAENQRREMSNLRVTIPAQGDYKSPWSLSNKMRTFPVRTAS